MFRPISASSIHSESLEGKYPALYSTCSDVPSKKVKRCTVVDIKLSKINDTLVDENIVINPLENMHSTGIQGYGIVFRPRMVKVHKNNE